MKRSPLKRKTPLRAKRPAWGRSKKIGKSSKAVVYSQPKRAPLRKVSKKKQAAIRNRYLPARAKFLEENPRCIICVCRGVIPPARSTEVHHVFGRTGSLLWDARGFAASCRACREWPHENPKIARELGLLGGPREWGVPIDRH